MCVRWRPWASGEAGARGWTFVSGSADRNVVLWRVSLTVHGAPGDAPAWGLVPAVRLAAPCPAHRDAAGRYRAADVSQGVREKGGMGIGAAGTDWGGTGEWRVVCEALWLKDGHEEAVTCCVWAPGGEEFASGDAAGAVAVSCAAEGVGADARRGMVQWRARRHTRRVVALAFSRSGLRLMSCGEDALLLVYAAASGHVQQSVNMGTSLVLSLAWCPDEDTVLLTTGGKRVKVLHLPSSSVLGALKLPLAVRGVPQRVAIVMWDPYSVGMLLGLADFSVVYLRTAAAMVRHAVHGLLLRSASSLGAADGGGEAPEGVRSVYSSLLYSSVDTSTSMSTQSAGVVGTLFSSLGSAATLDRSFERERLREHEHTGVWPGVGSGDPAVRAPAARATFVPIGEREGRVAPRVLSVQHPPCQERRRQGGGPGGDLREVGRGYDALPVPRRLDRLGSEDSGEETGEEIYGGGWLRCSGAARAGAARERVPQDGREVNSDWASSSSSPSPERNAHAGVFRNQGGRPGEEPRQQRPVALWEGAGSRMPGQPGHNRPPVSRRMSSPSRPATALSLSTHRSQAKPLTLNPKP